MKNLENYGVLELNTKEMSKTQGGRWGWWLAGSILYDTLKWYVTEDNEGYGRRMMQSGSAGGAK